MDTPSSEVNPLDSLAEEFVERHQRGEKPTVDEYTAKHPQLAAEMRDLFPALVMGYQALQQPEDAYAERYLAEDWLTRTNKDRPPSEANMPPPGFPLADWVEYQVLRREAERVFGACKP